jgi:hypothetical protein
MIKEKLSITKEDYSSYVKYNLTNETKECLSSLIVERKQITTKYKVLYLCNFFTEINFRYKGYGKLLLTKIINRYKGKYDKLYLYACPFLIYGTSDNGLKFDKLIKFYESAGLKRQGEIKYNNNIDGSKYQKMAINLK